MIIVISTIECRNDSVDYIKTQLCSLVAPTKKEFGCIAYNFYQDEHNKSYFNSYEIWESRIDLDNHLKSKHIKMFISNTKPYLTNFVIRQMKQFC